MNKEQRDEAARCVEWARKAKRASFGNMPLVPDLSDHLHAALLQIEAQEKQIDELLERCNFLEYEWAGRASPAERIRNAEKRQRR